MKSISIPLAAPAKPLEGDARAEDQHVEGEKYSFADYSQFHYPGTQLFLPEKKSLAVVKRFVILVPSESFSVADFLFQIHQYTPPGMTLLFITRVANLDEEMTARRQLILMENIARSPRIQVQSRIVFSSCLFLILDEGHPRNLTRRRFDDLSGRSPRPAVLIQNDSFGAKSIFSTASPRFNPPGYSPLGTPCYPKNSAGNQSLVFFSPDHQPVCVFTDPRQPNPPRLAGPPISVLLPIG